jgi:hypothetical protein
MRSLIRKWAVVAIMVMASAPAAGQNQRGLIPAILMTLSAKQVPSMPPALNPTAVVDRISSFDVNGDDRIVRHELPERMEGLISRGDKNHDGFLTPDEVVALVDTRPLARPTQGFIRRGPASLAEIVADLKLSPAMHDRATEIVNEHTVSYTEMRKLLDDEDYENFVAAAARLRNTPRVFVDGGIVGGVVRPASPPR